MVVEAGADGVEIHGANGYLVHQFLADGIHRRTDSYGASAASRARFAIDVARACADAIGADRVGFRISPLNPFNEIVETDTNVEECSERDDVDVPEDADVPDRGREGDPGRAGPRDAVGEHRQDRPVGRC